VNERVSEALPPFINNFDLKQELEALFSGKDLPEAEQVVVAERVDSGKDLHQGEGLL